MHKRYKKQGRAVKWRETSMAWNQYKAGQPERSRIFFENFERYIRDYFNTNS